MRRGDDMAISEKEAKKIAETMIKESGKNLSVLDMATAEDNEDEIYLFWVKDNDTGETYHPGEFIQPIRKSSGELIDFVLISPID